MRYRLRTLLIVAAIGPALLAGGCIGLIAALDWLSYIIHRKPAGSSD